MSKYYKAAGIRQVPDPDHDGYPLATIRTPVFNYFNIRKIEIDASFERPTTGTMPFRYTICAFYFYCHTGRYCLLANVELIDNMGYRFTDIFFPKVGMDTGVCDSWSNTFPSDLIWRNTADPRGKITMTFGDYASDYHFEVEHDGTKNEVTTTVTAPIPRLPHSSDHTDEAHLSPNYAASLGGHSVDWNVPGTATKGPKLTINYCPFSIYSFKAWDKNGDLVTDLRTMAITDDDGSNVRGGMYDALTNEMYEAVLRNDLGNSKFEPIDPDYSQELIFPETPARFFLGEQMPGEIYLGKNTIKSVKYGAETVWGDI